MYNNIPAEMRQLNQWINWANATKPDGSPTKIPINPKSLQQNIWQPVDVTNPTNFVSFNEAVAVATANNIGIGFVLTPLDPMVCIDLDDKPESPATDHERAVHEKMLKEFYAQGAYIEQSPSGRGWHIWTRGAWPANARHRSGHIEVYDRARFIACTGVGKPLSAPLPFTQQSLNDWAEAMGETRPAVNGAYALDQIDSGLSDEQVAQAVLASDSSTKFISLCKGEWQALGYPSQSEADFALLSILAFYSVDNAQVRRMFRCTALGQRAKAQRNDYLDRSLGTIRARAGALTAEQHAVAKATAQAIAANEAPREKVALSTNEIAFPPGIMGEVAQAFYEEELRPVREVALAAAYLFFGAIFGRCFNVNETGLNVYMALVAKTGTGKEGAQRSISRLIGRLRPFVPGVVDFFGPGKFSSGQAMIRKLDEQACFGSVLGEFGLVMKQLNDPHAGAHLTMLRGVLLDLFTKSGWEDILYPTAYSDVANNTKAVRAPAVSLLGETTPESLYDNLDLSNIADGLLPRFHIIEYGGERVPTNRRRKRFPEALLKRVAEVVSVAIAMKQNHTCAPVQATPEAQGLLDAYDTACDKLHRDSVTPGERDLWSRDHLKALRFSALPAVADNPQNPCITYEVAAYATKLVHSGTLAFIERMQGGDIGQGENKQAADLRRFIQEYFAANAEKLKSYKARKDVQTAGFVPYSYLVVRSAQCASFYKDRMGATHALKNMLGVMLETEKLTRLDPVLAKKNFSKIEPLYSRGNNW